MKIAIYSQNYFKDSSREALHILLNTLKNYSVDIYVETDFYHQYKKQLNVVCKLKQFKVLDASFSLLISIGGDGTILRAVTYVKDLNIPMVGINTGRLGFLATIQNEEIELALNTFFKGNYTLSTRSLLSVETKPEYHDVAKINFALNEITISRKNTTSMISVETYLNKEYLTSYWADGLILTTPTGSTGYSLSCGGPVIIPRSNNFALTPIAPHNLNARPLIIPDDTVISFKVYGRENQFLLSLDSRISTLDKSTIISVKKAPFSVKMVELENETFLDTLRKKLLWGEDKRN